MTEELTLNGTPSKPLTPAESNARSLVALAGRLADLALTRPRHKLHHDLRFATTVLQDVYWNMGAFVRLAESLRAHGTNRPGDFQYQGELQQVFCLVELELNVVRHRLEDECKIDSRRSIRRYRERLQVYLGCLRVIYLHLDDDSIDRNVQDVLTVRQALEAQKHMEREYMNKRAREHDESNEEFTFSLRESMIVRNVLLGGWEWAVEHWVHETWNQGKPDAPSATPAAAETTEPAEQVQPIEPSPSSKKHVPTGVKEHGLRDLDPHSAAKSGVLQAYSQRLRRHFGRELGE